jgi:hypothetical protein
MWPNSSDSNTPSAMPPAFTVTIGRLARGDTACSACATRLLPVPFSPVMSTLASDGPTRAIISSTGRIAPDSARMRRVPVGLQGLVGGLELPAAAERTAQFGLRPDDRQQPLVVPRLLDEVARAAPHRFDRDVHRAPGRHHHHRERFVGGVDALQQVEPFLARRGVARVVQVHQDDVEVLQFESAQQLRGDEAVSMRSLRASAAGAAPRAHPADRRPAAAALRRTRLLGRFSAHPPPSRP